MRILILEDEPIIAIDLEDIVLGAINAEILLATTARDARRLLKQGVDFAILDINLGANEENSLHFAEDLMRDHIPFCFISGSLQALPATFRGVPKIAKPFSPRQVANILPAAC